MQVWKIKNQIVSISTSGMVGIGFFIIHVNGEWSAYWSHEPSMNLLGFLAMVKLVPQIQSEKRISDASLNTGLGVRHLLDSHSSLFTNLIHKILNPTHTVCSKMNPPNLCIMGLRSIHDPRRASFLCQIINRRTLESMALERISFGDVNINNGRVFNNGIIRSAGFGGLDNYAISTYRYRP